MTTRDWQGPAILSHGFRPFFLSGAAWAVISMAIWVGMIAGLWLPPTAFDVVSWHAHALLVGYLGAAITGFLLTAVPNWTGRLPFRGAPLAALIALWVAGRLAVLFSLALPASLVLALDVASLVALTGFLAREIIVGRNWKNLPVLFLLSGFVAGAVLFHLDHIRGLFPVDGAGFRLLTGTAMMMIALIGGRIIPSFTRNWLVKQASPARPAPPMQVFDRISLAVLLAALALWIAVPHLAGLPLIAAGGAHIIRLARWQGHRTLREPLLFVLHMAYAFLPAGAVALGVALASHSGTAAALHLWMAGAIGMMTLSVMTRASLGHTGRPLHAGGLTSAIFVALFLAVSMRFLAGLALPTHVAYTLAGLFWITAFGLFVAVFGPILLAPRLPR